MGSSALGGIKFKGLDAVFNGVLVLDRIFYDLDKSKDGFYDITFAMVFAP